MTRSLATLMQSDHFAGYAYAYPHKTSYRALEPSVPLAEAWQDEDKQSLFLYVHLPFCEMRCGFCNLFTTVRPSRDFVARTLGAIGRQSSIVSQAVRPGSVTQVAFGGGTPSFLSLAELQLLFSHVSRDWPVDWLHVPVSFEVSPATVDRDKLAFLRSVGVDRISMGVQSFSPHDLSQLGRPQSNESVESAIDLIRQQAFPVFNLDLIYGSAGQQFEEWVQTVERAIAIHPEEVYLYPLYVRELTGLGRTGKSADEQRRELFLVARDRLVAAGYECVSMRLFRRQGVASVGEHCCQEDGMVGLGPGARSYTRSLHYSSEYAVGQTGVNRIIEQFNVRTAELAVADYGVHLCEEEQRRRYLIKSLLRNSGLDLAAYQSQFDSEADADFPCLKELDALDLCQRLPKRLRLNETGISWSDVIGPWLYSEAVSTRMEAYELA